MSYGPPTEDEIRKISRRAVNIISNYFGAKNVCVFGSAASALWTDIQRVPRDIDIVVTPGRSQRLDAEEIKESITEADDRFYTRPSKMPGATHKVLYCRLPGWKTSRREVKVDILVPPTALGIPRVLSRDVVYIEGIPVMPLFGLLVMKIQGWSHRRASSRPDFRDKVEGDETDVYALLGQAGAEGISYWEEQDRYTQEFMDHARTLALEFIATCGGRKAFRDLGFPVGRRGRGRAQRC